MYWDSTAHGWWTCLQMFLSFLEGKLPEPSLARNLDDLRRLVQTLTERGVCVEFIRENLTFTGEASPMAT